MARIISFRVDGLAGREASLQFELQSDVNVFHGINGSGKTTLLKILHSAFSTETRILDGLPFTSAEVTIYLNRHESIFTRKIEQASPLERFDDTRARHSFAIGTSKPRKLRPKWRSDPPEPDGDPLTTYRGGYLPISRLYRTVGSPKTEDRAMSEEELDAGFAAEVERRWANYQADVSDRVSRAQGEGLAQILHLVLSGENETIEAQSSLEISDAYGRVASFLGRQEGFEDVLDSREDFGDKYRKNPRIQAIVKQIDEVEKEIERVNAPQQRLRELLETMYRGNKRIVFSPKEILVQLSEKTKIGLPSLSSGEKQLFFIALEAIRSGGSSLIIDEPELSMHVDWQKKLISSLQLLNPRMQLIMATHSPEIMADLSDKKVFRL